MQLNSWLIFVLLCIQHYRELNLMYQHKLEKDIRCPLEYGLQVFGGKWKSRIICVLAESGTLRYSMISAY